MGKRIAKTKGSDEKGTDVSMIITDRLCCRSAAPRDVGHPPPNSTVRGKGTGSNSGQRVRTLVAVWGRGE